VHTGLYREVWFQPAVNKSLGYFYSDLSEVLKNFVTKPLTKVLFLSCISNCLVINYEC
jgi:hypothetical protein